MEEHVHGGREDFMFFLFHCWVSGSAAGDWSQDELKFRPQHRVSREHVVKTQLQIYCHIKSENKTLWYLRFKTKSVLRDKLSPICPTDSYPLLFTEVLNNSWRL